MKTVILKSAAIALAFLFAGYSQAQQEGRQNTKYTNDVVPDVCEKSAEFPGGFDAMNSFVSSTLEYPQQSKENGVEGKVVVKFIVETDGSISNVEILRGLDEYCNRETLRIIKAMPRWKPAEDKGKKVRQHFVIPIQFKLF